MKKRTFLKTIFRIILICLILFVLFLFWIIFFESGLKFVYSITKSVIPGTLKIAKIEGSLWRGVSFHQCEYQTGSLKLFIKPFENNKNIYKISGALMSFGETNPIIFSGKIKMRLPSSPIMVENLEFYLNKRKIITFNAEAHLPSISFTQNFLQQNIKGSYHAKLNDFSLIYRFIPVISRIKADIEASGEISGNMKQPNVSLNAEIKNAIFSLPKQHITIKQFNVKLSGLLNHELTLKGQGVLGGNPFYIQGKLNPFIKGYPGLFELNGKEIRLFNTEQIRVVASPHLKLKLGDHKLEVNGDVKIVDADIYIKEKMNTITHSKDIVWVNGKQKEVNEHPLKIIPHIHLIIDDNVRFKGYGFDSEVRGNLLIEQRVDGAYTAEGRITFNHGKYRLPGGIGYIDRGHLLYSKGTLLIDPVVDIRVLQKRKGNLTENKDVGVYVQGTLQKPIFHLFSNQQLDQSSILSELGIGGSEVSGAQKDHQWLSQTASLLGGGANPIVGNIQSRLGFEEFGIQTRETTKFISTQEGIDTTLVVGKSLSDRIYLQFLQGMLVPVSTLRLQYFLNPNVAASIETSTSGLGGDLSFSIED